MNHPFDKWMKFELLALISVAIIGVGAIARGTLLLVLLGLYAIAASLLFNGLAALSVNQHAHAVKQFARAIMLFILASVLAMGI